MGEVKVRKGLQRHIWKWNMELNSDKRGAFYFRVEQSSAQSAGNQSASCNNPKYINPSTTNDRYRGRTAPLTSKRCILYIYSTNICTEYFKHGIYSPFSFQNAVCFIILTYLVHVLFIFYIQSVLKFKKIIPAPKG